MKFWAWYNRQCGRPYVGLLMIPLTVGAVFLPAFVAVGVAKYFRLIP